MNFQVHDLKILFHLESDQMFSSLYQTEKKTNGFWNLVSCDTETILTLGLQLHCANAQQNQIEYIIVHWCHSWMLQNNLRSIEHCSKHNVLQLDCHPSIYLLLSMAHAQNAHGYLSVLRFKFDPWCDKIVCSNNHEEICFIVRRLRWSTLFKTY